METSLDELDSRLTLRLDCLFMCVQASSEKVRRAADASIAAKDEEAAKAAEQLQEVQAEEQKAQAHIKTLKEQLTGMRSSRFKANDLLTRCVTMMYVFQLITSWLHAEQVLPFQSSVFEHCCEVYACVELQLLC